jgi:adenylylsulfate kinase
LWIESRTAAADCVILVVVLRTQVSKLFADCGALCLVSFISPYREDRQAVRDRVGSDFIEVHMHVPLEVCEQRDPKGLYKKAREGKITGFTGIDDPYEAPENPEICLTATNDDGSQRSPEELAASILSYLQSHSFLSPSKHASQSASG